MTLTAFFPFHSNDFVLTFSDVGHQVANEALHEVRNQLYFSFLFSTYVSD